MADDDESFAVFEHSVSRMRSVLEIEQERVAKGYPPDEALLEHGAEIEDAITRQLADEAGELRAGKRPAIILEFPAKQKSDDA